jgi:hypothetical protein
MFAQSNHRPLPLGIGFTPPFPVDEIGWTWAALDGLYRLMEQNSRLYGTKAYDGHLMRVLLLSENLPHAAAEIGFRGTSQSLGKIIKAGKQIAASAEIEVHGFPSLPDLDGWRCDKLPEFLGIGEPESEHDAINKVRNELDGLFDDARTGTHDLRVDIALLWAGLSRAEAEMDYLGHSTTLSRIHDRAAAIAGRLGVSLVNLDAEVAAAGSTQHKTMAA